MRALSLSRVMKSPIACAIMLAMKMTTLRFTNRRYLDAIDDHIVIFDGAMGTSIQSYDLSPADYGGRTLPTEDRYAKTCSRVARKSSGF